MRDTRRNTVTPDIDIDTEETLAYRSVSTAAQAYKAVIRQFTHTNQPLATSRDLSNLLATSATIFAATTYRADNLSLVTMDIKDESGNSVPESAHPVIRLLKRRLSKVLYRSEMTMCFWGTDLVYKEPGVFGGLRDLRWVNPNLWTMDVDREEGLRGFRIQNSMRSDAPDEAYLDIDDCIYLHSLDFTDDFGGVGPVESAFLHAGIEIQAGSTAYHFFENMGIPPAIIQPAADAKMVGPADADILTGLLRRVAQGVRNYGRTIVHNKRWEHITLQAPFEDLAMPELTSQARNAIFSALGVPAELIMPSEGNYAQLYEARRAWIQTRLVPRAFWYASGYQEQLIDPIHEGWTIVPNFNRVPGMKEDRAVFTNVINAQVAGGYRDLYSAQVEQGITPDENLRGIYMIGGVPVPGEKIRDYYTLKAGVGSPLAGGVAGTAGVDGQNLAYSTTRQDGSPRGSEPAPRPPEAERGHVDQAPAVTTLMSATTERPGATAYWASHDSLTSTLKSTWLDVYIDAVINRLKEVDLSTLSEAEFSTIIESLEPELQSLWLGTDDSPGALVQLYLAGVQTGLTGGLPRAQKASPQQILQSARTFVRSHLQQLFKGLNATTRDIFSKVVGESRAQDLPPSSIHTALSEALWNRQRAADIAGVEAGKAYTAGVMRAWSDSGVYLKRWRTAKDVEVCPRCRALEGVEVPIDDVWHDSNDRPVSMPLHRACRCFPEAVYVAD